MPSHTSDKQRQDKSYTRICSSSNQANRRPHIALVPENKKPFKWDRCQYSAVKKSIIKKHIASVHEKQKTFKCDQCQ